MFKRFSGSERVRNDSTSSAGDDDDNIDPNQIGPFGRVHHEPETYSGQYQESSQEGQGQGVAYSDDTPLDSNNHHHQFRHHSRTESTGWHNVQQHHPHRQQSTATATPQAIGAPLEPISSEGNANNTNHGYSNSDNYDDANTNSEAHLVNNAGGGGARPTMQQVALNSNQSDLQRTQTSLFDAVHGKKKNKDGRSTRVHIAQHGEDVPVKISHLFKRPLIRQWLHKGELYREKDEREPSRFELFFDLSFVGIAHILAQGAEESPTGINLAKFVLIFFPAYSVWTDTRSYINVSGTDDVWQRLYILAVMLCLLGYAGNSSAISIEAFSALAEGMASEGSEPTSAAGGSETTLHERSGAEHSSEPAEIGIKINDNYFFTSNYHHAIKSAVAFYLVAKLMRLGLFLVYGILLPKFRRALWSSALALTVISCIWLPLLWVESPVSIVTLTSAGIFVEFISRYVLAAGMQVLHGRMKHSNKNSTSALFIPAMSIEHLMERMILFTILIVGESILNSTYTATDSAGYGLTAQFGRAAIAVAIAFLLIWLYFDADSSRCFAHALRRHWSTSISFSNIHYPLCAALILMGASLTELINEKEVEVGYRWYFAGSISTATLCIGIIGLLHKNLDVKGSSVVPKTARVTLRFIIAAAMALLPLKEHFDDLNFLAIYMALLVVLVSFETLGKLGAVGRHYDSEKTSALRQRREKAMDAIEAGQKPDIRDESEIPMSRMEARAAGVDADGDYHTSFGEKVGHQGSGRPNMTHSRANSIGASSFLGLAGTAKEKIAQKWDKDEKSPADSDWHEWEDLTGEEKGEGDVGIESELGNLECKVVSSSQRWAFAA